ncbi:unnamed protein product [Pseudo-nitzschia multistriata]|uniref:Guanylate kinase-like domain-containing protein n=1 Tax=Pseudo-nitzschia multistriata TaxID=183589 RepID=A0A448Z7U0_9STRA|nr:unnamed protein product [Pseudo-nitzschia multistriata]
MATTIQHRSKRRGERTPPLVGVRSAAALAVSSALLLALSATPSVAFQSKATSAFANFRSTASFSPSVRLFAESFEKDSSKGNSDNITPKQQPYVRMTEDNQSSATRGKSALLPSIGDVVRYTDLDGGDLSGQVLVGKISYVFGSKTSGYSVELNELEDVGDGYFAEYSSALRNRKGRKTERRLDQVSPLAASFVGSEQAYKVPLDRDTGLPSPRQATYDIDRYEGPAFYQTVDQDVLERDAEDYSALKSKLFRNVALTGLVGTILANASYGSELAVIYFFGSVASLLYLFLLSVKTDTVAVNQEDNTQNLVGTPIANLRFGAPALVLIGVSLWNSQKMSSGLGGADDFQMRLFDTVSRDQFAAAVLGFLTYRLPLFVGQIRDAFQKLEAETDNTTDSSGIQLPGSAGVAAKLLGRGTTAGTDSSSVGGDDSDLVTVLLVSGPQATGRSELVGRLLEDSSNPDPDSSNPNPPLVPPERVWKRDDGATFERLARRGEFLDATTIDNDIAASDSASGLTVGGIFDAARGLVDGREVPNKNVVVVDASVELAKALATAKSLPGKTRLIGIWVGLESVADFRKRLEEDIDTGVLVVPPDETKESFLRAKIKEIVGEIDFGLGAGIFEFTILNDASDPEKSLAELKEAASYAFK